MSQKAKMFVLRRISSTLFCKRPSSGRATSSRRIITYSTTLGVLARLGLAMTTTTTAVAATPAEPLLNYTTPLSPPEEPASQKKQEEKVKMVELPAAPAAGQSASTPVADFSEKQQSSLPELPTEEVSEDDDDEINYEEDEDETTFSDHNPNDNKQERVYENQLAAKYGYKFVGTYIYNYYKLNKQNFDCSIMYNIERYNKNLYRIR